MKNWKATAVECLTAVVLAFLIVALVPAVARAAGDMPPMEPPVGVAPDLPPGVAVPDPGLSNCYRGAGVCVMRLDEWFQQRQVMVAAGAVLEQLHAENISMKGRGCKPDPKDMLRFAPPTKGGTS